MCYIKKLYFFAFNSFAKLLFYFYIMVLFYKKNLNRMCKKHLLELNTPHRMPPFPPVQKPFRTTFSPSTTRPVCPHPASRFAIIPLLSVANSPLPCICLNAFMRLPCTFNPYPFCLQPVPHTNTFKLRPPSTIISRHQMTFLTTVVKESLRRA